MCNLDFIALLVLEGFLSHAVDVGQVLECETQTFKMRSRTGSGPRAPNK